MALVTKTRTYNIGDNLTADYYNQDRDEIIAGVNSIDNTQVASGANIAESKLDFQNAGGHDHDGVNSTKAKVTNLDVTGLTANKFLKVNSGGTAVEAASFPANRAFSWFLAKTLEIENDPSINPTVPQDMTCIKIWGYVKLPATGADITIQILKTTGTLIGTLVIPAGSNTANTTTFSTSALTAGDVLKMNIVTIGTSVAGQGLTIMLECQA